MYSEPSQTFNVRFFAKLVGCILLLTICAKHSLLKVLQADEYASDKTKQKPCALSFTSQKIMWFLPLLNSILSSHYYLALRHY